MTKKRGIPFLAFTLVFAAASLGFSQTSGTTSTSTSTNTINATVYASGGGDGRQLIQAMPGSGTTIIPGVTSGNSPWRAYWPVLNRCIPVSQLMAAPSGHSKVRVYKEAPSVVRDNPIDQVCLVDWMPNDIAHGNDRAIGEATGTGKDGYPDDSAFIPTLKKLVMETNTRRVAVQRRSLGQFHTKTLSGGLGGAGSVTADNNVGGSGAFGVSLGSSNTKNEDPVEFDIVALNDGPIDRPAVTKPVETETPTAPLPPQPVSPAPPVQTFRLEVVTVPSVQVSVPPVTTTPVSASMAITPAASCDLPGFVVDFGFNESNVKAEYLTSIKSIATWLENHPACKVQVEGHASTEGSFAFNAALARLRAKAVYDILAEDKNIQGQLTQFVSLSKDRATSERNPADRRVILRVVGNDSGR
jgi:outer membrane protein OmpA-like peptidoglycan-associated protein